MDNSTEATNTRPPKAYVGYFFVSIGGMVILSSIWMFLARKCKGRCCRSHAECAADAKAAKAEEAEQLKLKKYDCSGACYYAAPDLDEKSNPLPEMEVSPEHRNVLQMNLGECDGDKLSAQIARSMHKQRPFALPSPLAGLVAGYAEPFSGPFFRKGNLANSIRVIYCLHSLPNGWRIDYRLNGCDSFMVFLCRSRSSSFLYVKVLAGGAQGHIYKTNNGLFVAYPGGAEEFRSVDHFCVQFVVASSVSKGAIEVVSE